MRETSAAKPVSRVSSSDIETARRVLETEIAGLKALSAALDENFVKAIDTIQAMRDRGAGRLILAGIGKSGHVARKIAATLASTATPSHYIHPGEASHGDLGMITEDDVIILLSNSGENAELSDMIAYAKRFSIPLIAMTSNGESTLGRHADIPLVMPKVPEACPNGLAPTTSTTMMMALGDAIAIALLERTGLTAEQFRVWHPGGKLGQKLKKVSDLMFAEKDLPLVSPQTTMGSALITLTEKNLGSVIVVDDDQKLLGIVTDGDLKRHMGPDLLSKLVRDIMSPNPRTISPAALGVEAFDVMLNSGKTPITSLVVATDDRKVVGLLRVQELLRAGIS
jgi:arabinose-5-phosphate isomerase